MKIRNLFCFVVLFSGLSWAMHAAGNEGRVVLSETLRLEDAQADQFFKSPRRILEIPGQWIYLLDDQRALKFDAAGKGYGQVVPRGEGPGELTRVHYASCLGGQLALMSAYPFKVLLAGLDGSFQREFRPQEQGSFFNLEATFNDRLLLSRRRRDAITQAKQGVSTLPVELFWMDRQGNVQPIPLKGLSEQIYLRRISGEGRVAIAVNNVCDLKTCLDPARKRLYLAYTPRYAVEVTDLETGKRLATLKRPHEPVDYHAPPRDEEEEEENPSQFKPYEPEEFNDVLAIHQVLGELWVVTSDFSRDSGFRVDRFAKDLSFLGALRLKIPGVDHPDHYSRRVLEFTGDRLWVNQVDEEGNPSPVRFRVSM